MNAFSSLQCDCHRSKCDILIRVFVAFLVVAGGNLHAASCEFNYNENQNRHKNWLFLSLIPLSLCVVPIIILKRLQQDEEEQQQSGGTLLCLQLVLTWTCAAVGLPISAATLGCVAAVLWILPLLMSTTYVLNRAVAQGWCIFWISVLLIVALGLPLTLWRAGAASIVACGLAIGAMIMEISAMAIVAFDVKGMLAGDDASGGWDLVTEDEKL